MLKQDFLNKINNCHLLRNCGTNEELAYNFDIYKITDLKDVTQKINSL